VDGEEAAARSGDFQDRLHPLNVEEMQDSGSEN
jgi:hypothetical protein